MTEWERCLDYLPEELSRALENLPKSLCEAVQEIRLYAGHPVVLSTPQGNRPVPLCPCCTPQQLDECFHRLCGYAVHAHQEEIRHGYINTADGLRAGLAGRAVLEGEAVRSMRDITSICLRVSRRHKGCADRLLKAAFADGLCGLLLAGPPASGKTSLLRDLAAGLAEGRTGRAYRVAVVDERGELSAGQALSGCDVLVHCPKAEGISRVVRCLAPDVVVFDELGGREETEAVVESLNAGVAAITSVHAGDTLSLSRRPAVRLALESGAFDRIVLLEGKTHPGVWHTLLERKSCKDETDWLADVGFGLYRMGDTANNRSWSPDSCTGSSTAIDPDAGTAASLYGGTDGGDLKISGWIKRTPTTPVFAEHCRIGDRAK